jgi:transposase
MPYKTDKVKIDCPFLDRRRKLLPCQRERMIILHEKGFSQRKLASIFNVSRRLVQFVTDPGKKEKDLQNRRDRGGSAVYYKGGEEWAATMREHRRYKYKTLKDSLNEI